MGVSAADIHIDFETKSDVNLKIHGSHIYFESPITAPLMGSYARTGGAVKRWLPHEPCPVEIVDHARSGGRFVAHNASQFEFEFWMKVLTPRYGWPAVTIQQFRCTMATAAALGLPRALDKLGDTLGLTVKKDKIGKSLIQFFCVPRKNRPGETGVHFNEPTDHPEKFEQFRGYCDDDVRTEMEADSRMTPLSADEESVWQLDAVINARGIRIDRASVIAAMALAEKAKAELDARMKDVTGGAVTAASQVARLTTWLASRGVAMDGVAKDDILEALDTGIPDDAREVLLIRQEAGKTSIAKLPSFLKHAGADDRMRGLYVYHGAGPGRWTGAGGVNPANLPRPRALYEDADLDTATLFKAFKTAEPSVLRDLYGEELGKPLHLISDAMRGFLWAAPGHEFIAVDYSGIQGAIGAWLSKEEWKLQAMRDIIADPTLPDLYRRAAAGILNSTTEIITKKHFMRQAVGKTSELALLFAGGVSALVSMAANYGMRKSALHALYGPVWSAATDEAREKAVKRWEKNMKSRDRRKTDVLSREAWLACSLIVYGWRQNNPASTRAWVDLEKGMRDAMRSPGQKQRVLGRMDYLYANGFLWLRLPSRRCVAYGSPKLKDQVWAKLRLADGSFGEPEVVEREEAERLELAGKAKIEGATSQKVTALGFDSTTQRMMRYGLYGGQAMENACLGSERDILVRGMRNCEAAGYDVVMHTYDEAVAEMPRGRGSVEEMTKLMLDLDPWCEGLPLTAHGAKSKRYFK